MAPPEAKDNQILTSLMTALAAIGTPATDWLTAPMLEEGIPPDSIPTVDVAPRIYVHQPRTGFPSDPPPGPKHRWRTHFDVWIVAKDLRTANRVRADVLRAVYAAAGTLQGAYGEPIYPGPEDFTRRDDLAPAGVHVALQPFYIDHVTDDTDT
jgi:hypothetical protein